MWQTFASLCFKKKHNLSRDENNVAKRVGIHWKADIWFTDKRKHINPLFFSNLTYPRHVLPLPIFLAFPLQPLSLSFFFLPGLCFFLSMTSLSLLEKSHMRARKRRTSSHLSRGRRMHGNRNIYFVIMCVGTGCHFSAHYFSLFRK